eukprot:TRINITY_DN17070_c0_g1_i2.p1 TRINITY_DN17070_c0_g1~~TRINITY_DN17070_c0_g1_i2.p1  ORF type:complete len:560 (+),score=93.04 TRINITY_DN17070_c0_g1_i2:306-1985(+)
MGSLDTRQLLPVPDALAGSPVGKTTAVESVHFRDHMVDLLAVNERMSTSLDEMKAEHFFETSQLRSDADDAEALAGKATIDLEKVRAQASWLACEMGKLATQQKLQKAEGELRQCLQQAPEAAGETAEGLQAEGVALDCGDSLGGLANILRDLQGKWVQLSEEREVLQEHRDGLHATISSWRSDLSDSGNKLKRIEDACARTRFIAEQKRLQVQVLHQKVVELDAELDRMTITILDCATDSQPQVDESLVIRESQKNAAMSDRRQLQLEQARLQQALSDVRREVEVRSMEYQEEKLEAQNLAADCRASEQGLAEQESLRTKIVSELRMLQIQRTNLARRMGDLQSSHSQVPASQDALAPALGRQALLRLEILQEESSENTRSKQTAALQALRDQLATSEEAEAALANDLRARALQFSQEVGPLQAQVQRLHLVLAHAKPNTAQRWDGSLGGLASADVPPEMPVRLETGTPATAVSASCHHLLGGAPRLNQHAFGEEMKGHIWHNSPAFILRRYTIRHLRTGIDHVWETTDDGVTEHPSDAIPAAASHRRWLTSLCIDAS